MGQPIFVFNRGPFGRQRRVSGEALGLVPGEGERPDRLCRCHLGCVERRMRQVNPEHDDGLGAVEPVRGELDAHRA